MPKIIDLTHRVFDKLTVVRKLPTSQPDDIIKWECRCRCGSSKIVIGRTNQLTSGLLRSCGCLHREMVRKGHIKHGLCDSPEYRAWVAIKDRCFNKKNKHYNSYGGRGITVCPEWSDSFETFYRDMGQKPTSKHSIDRKDNNKGYYKNNCRWATQTEQANNKRNNLIYEFDGEIKTLPEWCREYNVDYMSVYNRIANSEMAFEDAINKALEKANDK